jgi:hypothetical protein
VLQKDAHDRESGAYPKFKAATQNQKPNLTLPPGASHIIMKSPLLTATIATLALASSAFAFSPAETKTEVTKCSPRVVPASVVNPTNLPQAFAGATINIEFSLDASGQPRDVRVPNVEDRQLKQQLVQAFKQWRFEGVSSDAVANGKRYVLPVELRPEA